MDKITTFTVHPRYCGGRETTIRAHHTEGFGYWVRRAAHSAARRRCGMIKDADYLVLDGNGVTDIVYVLDDCNCTIDMIREA